MTHDEVKAIHEAKALASKAGLFVAEKGGVFLIYRCCQPKNVLAARAKTPASLLKRVKCVATVGGDSK
ncbi:MAG: hypothetical protein EG825_00635 [Rhodocyclaceae bacterium]|nr:hypothetical protein [Rhodocyclaceae bacterium]